VSTRDKRGTADIYTTEQISRVLAGSGISVESEIDSDYIIYCPYHNNHRSPAGEIDKVTGTFFCFSCHQIANLIEFVMHTTGRTYFESARFIRSKATESSIEQIIDKALVTKPEYTQYDQVLIKRLNQQALDSPRAMRYYLGRLITEESVKKFSLGFSEKQDMVTIPVHSPDGMEIGFVGRSVEGKEFKNTPGLPKSKTLFNIHRVKTADRVYVVESSFDAIRLDQCGFPAVATLGANVSNFQTDLLQKYFNNIFVVADNDEAGGNMKSKLIEKLGGRVTVINIDKKYKDIGDMPDEAIKNLDESFDKSIAAMLN
jgi:predicted CXXCH cytochrome family protein